MKAFWEAISPILAIIGAILLGMCAAAAKGEPTPAPRLTADGWPLVDYPMLVNATDHKSAARNGFGKLAEAVEKTLLATDNLPGTLVVHSCGTDPNRSDGRFGDYGIDNYVELSREYQERNPTRPRHPLIDTLPVWGEVARRWELRLWLYVGGAQMPRFREMETWKLKDYITETVRIAKTAGFDGVFFDGSADVVSEGSWVHNRYALRWARDKCELVDMRIGVESWPHAATSKIVPHAPAWVDVVRVLAEPNKYGATEIGTWAQFHPGVSRTPWKQASSRDHGALVHVWHRPGQPYQLTPELAQRIVASGCVPAVPYQAWIESGVPGRPPRFTDQSLPRSLTR